MSVSGSPASISALSPTLNSADTSFPVFQIPVQSDAHQLSSVRPSAPNPTTISPLSTPRKQTMTAPRSFSTPHPPIAEESAHADTISSDGLTPLHSTIADRIVLMTTEEAAQAEHAIKEHGEEWYERSGLFNRHNGNDNTLPSRDRAFSAPVNGANLPSLGQTLETPGTSAQTENHHPKDSGFTSHKPTAQEWMADIDCVSGVLGAMLADHDRGAR